MGGICDICFSRPKLQSQGKKAEMLQLVGFPKNEVYHFGVPLVRIIIID